ncbi:hypothetical protein RhiirA4_463264 [Rhizophagus irregularis]|uniref:Uncharacterized protein n=1 Tax=Rhizophagus irregularis TaxID=588596 RepID=A0A2I1GMM5_9GLOM|nr:hypothetical protein RhiirA4_463264 [Rhizophagus irregularis]
MLTDCFHNITAKKTILGIGYANLARQPIGKPYIQVFTDSYKAGKPFSITAKNVPTPKLPDSYIIGVVVGDPTSNSKKPLDVYGCAYAVNSLRGEAYPIAGYPIEEFSYPIAERSYPIAERS